MSTLVEKLEALADKAKEWHERTRDWGKWTMPNTVLAMLEDWEKSVAALLADNTKEGERGLRWYPWVCINGHSNDHAKLAPDGTKMCSTPGCQAEAEARPAPAAPDMRAIIAGDGHPDEGPCVVCGAVFDTHEDGCVFAKAAAPDALLADALHQIEMGMEDWKAHGCRARARFAGNILAALAPRKAGEG
jgi:hypothetical protein